MAITSLSNGKVLGGHLLTSADKVAGEVVELDNWEIPIEQIAQVIAAFATASRKHKDVLVHVDKVANLYRIDVVAQQYVHLFESDMRRSR